MTEIKEILEDFKKDLSESNLNKLPIIYRLLKMNEQGLVSRDGIIRQLEEQNNHLYYDLTFTSAELERMKAQIEKVKHYLDYDIPHDLINEATTKIWRMLK